MSAFLSRLPFLRALTREQRIYCLVTSAAAVLLAWIAMPGPRAAKIAQKLAAAHEAGKTGNTPDYVAHWLPKAGLAGVVLAVVLLLGVRWLARPMPALSAVPAAANDVWRVRLLMLLTGAAMLFSAIANAPRLDFSLWGDEDATMRKSVVGQFNRNAEGRMEFDPVTWTETFYRYKDPNNHPLNSVLSRLSHTAFARDLANPEGFYFDERAMRLPVFAAGLLGLAALAWFTVCVGRPMLGCAAVPLLALHPWFVRYASESRGYGFLLLFTPLALAFLVKAADTGRWRWWIGYGLAQFLILWSYPGALHLLVALNVSAVCAVFFSHSPPTGWRAAQTGRWVVACAFGAALSLLALLPLVQPLMIYLKSPRMQGPMRAEWYADAFAWLGTGMSWRPWAGENPLCRSWLQFFTAQPAAAGACLAVLLGLFFAGIVWWWRQSGVMRALIPALLLHSPLFLLQSWATGGFVYAWYLFPALTGIVLVAAGGAVWFAGKRGVALSVACFALWYPVREWSGILRHQPIEGMREGTKLTRTISLPSDPRIDDVITVELAMATAGYDPASLPLNGDDTARMKEYLRQADREGKPLFVHYGSPGFARSVLPGVMAMVEDPLLFDKTAEFPGLDQPYTRVVRRYRPGSLPASDASATP